MKDLFSTINIKRVISPVVVSDASAQVGQIIDRQGFGSLTYAIATGLIPDANAVFTVLLEEGDAADLSDAAAVSDKDLLGSEVLAGFYFTDDDSCRKLGYRGNRRYTRLTITGENNDSASLLTAVAILGHPTNAQTVNPPA